MVSPKHPRLHHKNRVALEESEMSDSMNSHSSRRFGGNLLFRKSVSMDTGIPNERVRKKRFQSLRLSRRRKTASRSSSLPLEKPIVPSPSMPPLDTLDTSNNSSRKRTRRLSLNFLKREFSRPFGLKRDHSGSRASKSSRGTAEESDNDEGLSWMQRTRIVTERLESPAPVQHTMPVVQEQQEETNNSFSCATAILEHNYFERICGAPEDDFDDGIHATTTTRRYQLSEDPTVQESIECIFASQLEDGLGLWDDDDDDDQQQNELGPKQLQVRQEVLKSPSLLQQSRLNRSDRRLESMTQSKKRYEQASLVYMGTFDPSIPEEDKCMDGPTSPMACQCARTCLPALDPSKWPQAPLLLRPTPGKGTRIKGVRFIDSKEYLWEPGSHQTWSEALAEKWGVPAAPTPRVACCECCAVLPINNGNEAKGESMIIDFESDLFEGSLMLRIRFTNGTTKEPYTDSMGYFQGMNRRYQAVIRGRFKKAIPLTQLRTGFQFERPCGKLPAKWILRGGIKVLSFFAPQLDAKMEGAMPHSLTPLGSTPQSISVDSGTPKSMEGILEEPEDGERTLLGKAAPGPSSVQRARVRKKAFDKLFVHQSKEPTTDPSKIYTFEFLQHLFNFQDFSIELGSMLGSVHLQDILDGQPLQVMASNECERLWSFDVWHESLWEAAQKHDTRPR